MAVALTLKDYLDTAGVHYDFVGPPDTVTSLHAANETSISGEDLAKAVVLRDGDSYILAVIPATHHVQLGKLRKHFNRYIVLASEQDLSALFQDRGVGALPPIDSAYDIEVIFDNSLYDREDVYFGADDRADLIHISGKNFRGLMSKASHGEISQHN